MVAEASSSVKSTNVRIPLAFRVVIAGLRSTSHVFPALAAPWAEHLLFKPRRHPRPAREAAVLERGRRFELDAAGERLVGWSFGQGPTVLLVHGWDGRGAQLGALVEPLLARGMRVVTFDAPAHGESTGEKTTVFQFAEGLRAMVEHLGGVHGVVAHSFGAAATTVALKDGLKVDRVVYVAPWCSLFRAAEDFGERVGLSSGTVRLLHDNIMRRFAARQSDFDARNIAPHLTAPLLIVHDEDDQEVVVSEGRDLAAVWPGARLTLTKGLGHRRVLRAPELIEPAVEFLTRERA